MSFPTKPSFVSHGSWSDETRKHPAMKWMEFYTTNIIDGQQWSTPYSDWHTSDFTIKKSDGTSVSGGEAAWAELAKIYASFTSHLHDPYFLSCTETDSGYEMIGQAMVCANLPGQPSSGESKQKDSSGKEWDVKVPSAFHFWYVKDDKAKNGYGFLLKETQIMSDSGPIVVALLKRGVLSPADLGL